MVDQGYSKTKAGRSLDINLDVIRRKQREFEVDSSVAFSSQGKLTPDQQRIRDLENENQRLTVDGERYPEKGGSICAIPTK